MGGEEVRREGEGGSGGVDGGSGHDFRNGSGSGVAFGSEDGLRRGAENGLRRRLSLLGGQVDGVWGEGWGLSEQMSCGWARVRSERGGTAWGADGGEYYRVSSAHAKVLGVARVHRQSTRAQSGSSRVCETAVCL